MLNERPRRLRASPVLRSMVRETRLSVDQLILPLFVVPGTGVRRDIVSMPGVHQISVDLIVAEAEQAYALGIRAVLLFGIPEQKDERGSEAWAPQGSVQRAVRALRSALPDLLIITDVCLCEYTSHGHCGLLNERRTDLPQGYLLNDETLELLGQIAVSHAQAGAHIVAPSGMLDGMVGALREALDSNHFQHVSVLSYAVKYASAFYGPFRDAAGGAPAFGDRRTHQMDPGNVREALREARLDVDEGADLLMVKPALAYLDVIRQTREQYPELPLVAYNVSGEYALLKAGAAAGAIDERAGALEVLTAIKRAGADLIITYHAREAASWLQDKER